MEILATTWESPSQTEKLSLKKAIKDYKDTYLSGLTDDEKKEIEAKLAAYKEKCVKDGLTGKALQDAIDLYYRSLLKQYGAKFDTLMDKASDGVDGTNTTDADAVADAADKTAAVNAAGEGRPAQTNTQSTIQTDADGTAYLLVTSPNGVVMKIALASSADTNGSGGAENSFSLQKAAQAYEDMSLIS